MTSLFFGFLISIEKLPIISVCVALIIRLLPSRSTTLAIIIGPMASSTVPDMTLLCAIITWAMKVNRIVNRNFDFDIIILFLLFLD